MDLKQIKEMYPEIEVGTRAQDLTGRIFNNWKVLYRTKNNNSNKTMWVCECLCEKHTIKPVTARSLKDGASKDCGCGRLKTISDKADQKIHKRDENGNIILKKCSRCNSWLSLDNFWKNKAHKDGFCNECKNCQATAKENRYNNYKKNAKKRNLSFDLTKEQFYNLTTQPCNYCGEFIKEYNGIDRINSSIGYTLDNCVSCCEICNKMKLDYNIDFWLEHMNKILKFYKKREINNE